MGILYEEGSRRYLDALSTYMRRRIKQGAQADVTSVKHIPSALALRQRPSIPNERATVGTTTETFNVLRLIFSRLGSPVCPNGHRVAPSLDIAEAMSKSGEEMGQITCPTCGVKFMYQALKILLLILMVLVKNVVELEKFVSLMIVN